MPAPRPIEIRYGNGSDLLSLAGAAGQSQYANAQYDREYAGYMQRLGLDQQFLQHAADNQIADSHFRQQMDFNRDALNQRTDAQQSASELQDAYHQSLLALRQKSEDNDQQNFNARLEAQKSGAIGSARGRSSAAIDLVPAEGDINNRGGSAIIQDTQTGDVVQDQGGKVSQYNADGLVLRGADAMSRLYAQDKPQGEMVPRNVRRQLDMFRAEQGTLSPEDAASIQAAIRGGTMKDDQLIDNMRQAKMKAPHAPAMTYEAKQDAKVMETLHQTEALMGGTDPQKIAWAKRDAGSGGIFMDDKEALDHFMTANMNAKSVLAYQRPVTNSSGKTPTGGNVVQVQTPGDAAQLPSGTVYMAPDGQLRRIP